MRIEMKMPQAKKVKGNSGDIVILILVVSFFTLQILAKDRLLGKTTPAERLADTEEARTISVGWMSANQSSEHGTFSSC